MLNKKKIIIALLFSNVTANVYAAPADNKPDQNQIIKHQAEQQQLQIHAPVVHLQQVENANKNISSTKRRT